MAEKSTGAEGRQDEPTISKELHTESLTLSYQKHFSTVPSETEKTSTITTVHDNSQHINHGSLAYMKKGSIEAVEKGGSLVIYRKEEEINTASLGDVSTSTKTEKESVQNDPGSSSSEENICQSSGEAGITPVSTMTTSVMENTELNTLIKSKKDEEPTKLTIADTKLLDQSSEDSVRTCSAMSGLPADQDEIQQRMTSVVHGRCHFHQLPPLPKKVVRIFLSSTFTGKLYQY